MPSTTIRRAKNGHGEDRSGPISFSEFNHNDAKAAEMEENGTFAPAGYWARKE